MGSGSAPAGLTNRKPALYVRYHLGPPTRPAATAQ